MTNRYDVKDGEVSYLTEMLGHPANIGAACLSGIAACALLVATGPLGALVPVVGYVTGGSIASLFLPESVLFREYVNRQKRQERREAERERLINELSNRTVTTTGWRMLRSGGEARVERDQRWVTYDKMTSRVEEFLALASDSSSGLSLRDVEKLDDLTVDYLRLWLAVLASEEREKSFDPREINARIRSLNEQIDSAGAIQRQKMAKAREDLEKILKRHDGLGIKRETAEARMLALADNFEEVYHRLMANPSDVSTFLDDQIGRMEVEEEIDMAVDRELEELTGKRVMRKDPRLEMLRNPE